MLFSMRKFKFYQWQSFCQHEFDKSYIEGFSNGVTAVLH